MATDVTNGYHPSPAPHTQETVEHAPAHEKKAGMPQLDPASFASQAFWLVVSFVVLYLLMSSYIIPRIRNVLETRRSKIDQDLSAAETARSEAANTRMAYEKELASARDRANRRIEESLEAIRQKATSEQDTLAKKLNASIAGSEKNIASKRDAARAAIQPLAVDLAGLIVETLSAVKPDAASLKNAVTNAMEEAA